MLFGFEKAKYSFGSRKHNSRGVGVGRGGGGGRGLRTNRALRISDKVN